MTQSGGNWSVTGSLDAGNVTFGAMYPTITITDGNNTALTATVYGEVDVAAAALSVSGVSFTATAGTLFSGNVATFTSGDPYATADDFIARINWGDCSDTTYGIVTAVANSPGNFTVAGSYAYAGNGSYNVSVTITDDLTDSTATGNATATVTATPGIAPAQPALTAGNVTDSEIDLSYSESDNSHLELEEMAPGDVNFHFLADLGSGPVTNGSYEATGLTSAAGYDFRIRADQAGLVTYADAGMIYTKLPGGGSGPATNPLVPVPYQLSVPAANAWLATVDFNWDGNPGDSYQYVDVLGQVFSPQDPYRVIGADQGIGSSPRIFAGGAGWADVLGLDPGLCYQCRLQIDESRRHHGGRWIFCLVATRLVDGGGSGHAGPNRANRHGHCRWQCDTFLVGSRPVGL